MGKTITEKILARASRKDKEVLGYSDDHIASLYKEYVLYHEEAVDRLPEAGAPTDKTGNSRNTA